MVSGQVVLLVHFLLGVLLFSSTPTPAWGQPGTPVITYNTAFDCSQIGTCLFNNPDIWLPAGVPQPGFSVIINSTNATYIVCTTTISLANLNISGNVVFRVEASTTLSSYVVQLTNNASIVLSDPEESDNSGIYVYQYFYADDSSVVFLNDHTVLNITGNGYLYGEYSMSSDASFYCTNCLLGFGQSVQLDFASMVIMSLVIDVPGTDIELHSLTVNTLKLNPQTSLTTAYSFMSGDNVYLAQQSRMTVTGVGYFLNTNVQENTPPLWGTGVLAVADATVYVKESSSILSLFGGTLLFSGQFNNAYFVSIQLSNVNFDTGVYVNIYARGLQFNRATKVLGQLFAFGDNSNAPVTLFAANLYVTECIIAATGSVLNFAPGSYVRCDNGSLLLTNGSTLTTAAVQVIVPNVTVNAATWVAAGTSVDGSVYLQAGGVLRSQDGLIAVSGNYTQVSAASIHIEKLDPSFIPLVVYGNATLDGLVYYALPSPPSHTTEFTILTAKSIVGRFASTPQATNNAVALDFVFYPTSVALKYTEGVGGSGSKWWVAIIVILIVAIVALGAYWYIRKKKRQEYSRI